MKKMLFSAMGVALLVSLLAGLGSVVLASPAESRQVSARVYEDVTEAAPASVSVSQDEAAAEAIEQAVIIRRSSQKPVELAAHTADDGPEPGEEHGGDACGDYADGDKLALKIAAAAEFLGLSPEEITTQVQAGKRLYQIAADQGADVSAFKDAVHAVIGECGCGSH